MTGRGPWGAGPPDPLGLAVGAYSAAFPRHRWPALPGRAGGLGGEAAVGMLRRAVAADEPLEPWAIMAALGIRPPPDGALR